MSDPSLIEQVAQLLGRAAAAHHEAFIDTDGVDPDWSIWYADYLCQPLGKLLDQKLSRSRLISCLLSADSEHRARHPEDDWKMNYAKHLIERYAASEAPSRDVLQLFYFQSCPFCVRVLRVIDQLGVDVELLDIHKDRARRDELVAARGRSTVPVLRIIGPDGTSRLMPESADIVAYLQRTYGNA